MARKEEHTLAEQADPPIWGLSFVASEWFKFPYPPNRKFAYIEFPSGFETNLFTSDDPAIIGYVCLFEQIDIPLASTRDQTYAEFLPICEEHGYLIRKIGEHQLEFDCTYEPDEHFIVTYDPELGRVVDVEQIIAEERW